MLRLMVIVTNFCSIRLLAGDSWVTFIKASYILMLVLRREVLGLHSV